jgi:hypothetical protein
VATAGPPVVICGSRWVFTGCDVGAKTMVGDRTHSLNVSKTISNFKTRR